MIKVGITGSIASGKTTASELISADRGPLFNADKIVKKLYTRDNLKIKKSIKFKKSLKDKILDKNNLKLIEKLIHPLVRKEMLSFTRGNKKKKFLFFEIPLLIESKLTKYFDITIFIRSNKNLRLKRYLSNGGGKKLFHRLDIKQMKDIKKMKFCNHVVVNNKSLPVLKRKLLDIIKIYE